MPYPPQYSLAERDRRWAIARDIMDDEDVAALVVYGEHEMAGPAPFAPDAYFTNDRPGGIVVLTRDADPVVLVWGPAHVLDHIEARRRGEASWIEPASMRIAKHDLGLVDVLAGLGLSRAPIGVIGLEPCPPFHFNPIMPYTLWASVLRQLPHAVFKPAWLSFLLRTMPQSAEEIAVLEYAAAAAGEMAAVMRDIARPGESEAGLYAAAMSAGHQRGIAAPYLLLSSGPGFVSWGPPAWSYRPQPPRIIKDGDVILAELFCSYGMRETQTQVAIAVGDVHPDTVRAAGAARSAYTAGLAALRAGNTFGDVCAAVRSPLSAAGGTVLHPLVHGLNPYTTVTGFGADLRRLPEASDYGQLAEVGTVGHELRLVPGMTFSVEPNCLIGRHQVQLGGTVIVGADGPVELTPATAQLLRTGRP
jgi:Xaa-Pro aminopeptidase